MPKKSSDESRWTKTGKATVSNGKCDSSSKSASGSALSQRNVKSGSGRHQAKSTAGSALSSGKNAGSKTSSRDHVAKGNEYMLHGWKSIARSKDREC